MLEKKIKEIVWGPLASTIGNSDFTIILVFYTTRLFYSLKIILKSADKYGPPFL